MMDEAKRIKKAKPDYVVLSLQNNSIPPDFVVCAFLCIRIGVTPASTIEGYDTATEAAEALSAFIRRLAVNPTMIVGTGTEYQVYWVFDQALTLHQFRFGLIAGALVQAAQATGLKFDAASTLDPNCLLSVAGTINYETDPPSPVTLIMEGEAIPIKQMLKALGVETSLDAFFAAVMNK